MENSGQLALFGGDPVRTEAFPPWPYFDQKQLDAVNRILSSGKVNYWTGKQGAAFEQEFARATRRNYAIALANGTIALEVALFALGIGQGDEVIVPCRSFVASASCICMQNATPVFADIDADSQNITATTLEEALTDRTKAVVVVHLAGWPCDMDPILEVAAKYQLKVIEDCAQAHGAKYKGYPVGSFGDVGVFSFCQDKIISTAGEGGMLVTDDEETWEKAWSYKDHGKSVKVLSDNQPGVTGYRFVHDTIGTNLRLTEMQSAIGRIQLGYLDSWVEKRRENAKILNDFLRDFDQIRTTEPSENQYHSYYKYYCFIRKNCLNQDWNRDRVMQAIAAEGVPVRGGVCPEIYKEKAFSQTAIKPLESFSIARELGETSLMFMVHPTMSADDMWDKCRAVEKVLEFASM